MKVVSNKDNLQILHEDNHIIAINKRIGDIVQGDKTGDKPLSEVVKEYIKEKYNKPGEVFLGVVHRLDRETSGVLVFAKSFKIREKFASQWDDVEKKYLAILWTRGYCGCVRDSCRNANLSIGEPSFCFCRCFGYPLFDHYSRKC